MPLIPHHAPSSTDCLAGRGPGAGIAPREGAERRQFVEEVAAAARENEEAVAPATPSWGTAPLLAEPRRPARSGERQEPPVGGSRQ